MANKDFHYIYYLCVVIILFRISNAQRFFLFKRIAFTCLDDVYSLEVHNLTPATPSPEICFLHFMVL